MAIGKRRKGRQQELFVAASEIRVLGNPFYRALDKLLDITWLIGFRNRALAEKRGRPSMLVNWAWNYLFIARAVRLILPSGSKTSR